MTREAWIWLGIGAGVGVAAGALAALFAAPTVDSGLAAADILENVSSGQTVNPGWVYFTSLTGPGAADVASLSSMLQSAGFVDATTGGAPQITAQSSSQASALVVYRGSIGGTVPASTSNLAIQMSGYPSPSVLSA